jgi:hypothetical protein
MLFILFDMRPSFSSPGPSSSAAFVSRSRVHSSSSK